MALGDHHHARGDHAVAGGRSTSDLLEVLVVEQQARHDSVLREWATILEWADLNQVPAGPVVREAFLDTGIQIGGAGTPAVSEFALMELTAVLGRSPDGGRVYVARILDLAHRLPHLHRAVTSGRLAPWRAERIADLTHRLSLDAAAYVDRQLGTASVLAARAPWAQIERLTLEATLRFDPDQAAADQQAATATRFVTLEASIDTPGHSHLTGLLDTTDAADLDHALSRRAEVLGRLGDTTTLDVRRATALGELARNDLTLDLLTLDAETGEQAVASPGRVVTLTVHITPDTLTDTNPVGRWDHGTHEPVTTTQIKQWLGSCAARIVVRPVIDLADCAPVDSYEIPDRHRTQVTLRDHTCRFPHCTRPAQRCDLDHALPHADGGSTCPCNLVPLCRRHHRAKTHSHWTYTVLDPGHYLWTTPTGRHLHVGPRGTQPVHLPRRPTARAPSTDAGPAPPAG